MRPSMPTRNCARRRLVRREPARLAAGDETRSGSGRCSATPAGEEAAVERELARAQVQAVQLGGRWLGSRSGSLGEPIWLAAGTIRPRAPRRVFSHSSASWMT